MKLVVVGCGAIAERFHLPALARAPGVIGSVTLVDAHLARAEALARQFGARDAAASLEAGLPGAEGVLVLTPARLHVPMTLASLAAGAHVLCEKPLATTGDEVDAIIAAASRAGRHVAVNNTRRLVPAFRLVRQLIDEGAIGHVQHVELSMGEPFDWPSAGDGYFGRKAGGRGVLADIGAHLVDLAAWWLGAAPQLTGYADDAAGGTEAMADLRFRTETASGRVQLSWLSRLANRYEVRGSEGTLSGAMYDATAVTLRRGTREETRRATGASTFLAQGEALIGNFLDVVRGTAAPLITAADVRASIALIDAAYANRQAMAAPWHDAWRRLADV